VAGAVTVSVTVAIDVTVAEAAPGVPEAAVWVEVAVEVLPSEAGAMVSDGAKVDTVGVEVDPLQAETATAASKVRAPQHTAVSFTRNAVPAIVVRTFMGPPHAPGR
jgi:hypothetical protein